MAVAEVGIGKLGSIVMLGGEGNAPVLLVGGAVFPERLEIERPVEIGEGDGGKQ